MIHVSLGLIGKVNLVVIDPPDADSTTFIPEPGLATLFVLAAAGIALRRRRRAA